MFKIFKKDFFNYEYFFSIPNETRYIGLFYIFYLALFFIAIFSHIYLRKYYRKNVILQDLRFMMFWGYVTFSFTGFFLMFSRQQGLPFFATRFANYLLLITIFSYSVYLFIHYKRSVLREIRLREEKKRIKKWLPEKKKGKKA